MRVEVLARALGVTKGGFYRHFPDRPALFDGMLDAWERLVIDRVIERVEAGGGDARAKLRRLYSLGSSTGGDFVRIELAIRDWARRDADVLKRLRRIDNRRMDYLRSLFAELCPDEDEADVRSLTVLALFVGVPSIAGGHNRGRRRELHRRAYERLIES